jgi:hypothetical protein
MRRIGVIPCVLLCVFVGAAGLAGAAHAAARTYLVTYEGSYSEKAHSTSVSGTSDYTDTLTWTMKAYYDSERGTVTRSLVAQGSHVSVNTGAFANNNYDCTLRQSGRTADLPITVGSGDAADTLAVTASIPAGAGAGGALVSSGTGHCELTTVLGATDPDGSQQTGGCAAFSAASAFALVQSVRNARAEGFTKRIDLDQTATPTGGCQNGSTFTATRSIHAKLVVGGGGPSAPASPGPPPPDQERQKVFARGDLLTTLLRAQGPCGLVAIGSTAAVFGSTVGPTGAAAFVPASFLLAAGGPLCVAYTLQAFHDVEIANDPPAGNVNVIANPAKTPTSAADAKRLPTCAGRPAAVRSFCSALRANLADAVAAAQRGAAVAAALLTTVDRETKARKTHHAAALKRQLAAGDALVRALKAARRSEGAIGAKIASLITAQHVTGQLTAQQDATAIAAVLRRLKAHGVRQATLRRLAPSALTPAPYDLVAHLR